MRRLISLLICWWDGHASESHSTVTHFRDFDTGGLWHTNFCWESCRRCGKRLTETRSRNGKGWSQ